jgi:hypothetical protein
MNAEGLAGVPAGDGEKKNSSGVVGGLIGATTTMMMSTSSVLLSAGATMNSTPPTHVSDPPSTDVTATLAESLPNQSASMGPLPSILSSFISRRAPNTTVGRRKINSYS